MKMPRISSIIAACLMTMISICRIECATKCYFCNSCTNQVNAVEQDCEKQYGIKMPFSCQTISYISNSLDRNTFSWGGSCLPTSLCDQNVTKIEDVTIYFGCCEANLCNTFTYAMDLYRKNPNNANRRRGGRWALGSILVAVAATKLFI